MKNAFALNCISKDTIKGLKANEQAFTEAVTDLLSFSFPT